MHVEDTGEGITQEEIPQLFTRLGKQARTAEGKGIGLGLTMVKQIVESAGGQIGVESAGRDKGSTFKISMRMQAVGPAKTSHQLHNSLLRMTDNVHDQDRDAEEEDLEAP